MAQHWVKCLRPDADRTRRLRKGTRRTYFIGYWEPASHANRLRQGWQGRHRALQGGMDKTMRVFLRDSVTTEQLLEELVNVCGEVIEGSVPEGRRTDLTMGIYVAMRRILSQELVKNRTCGSLPDCMDLKEESPFESTLRIGARAS